MSRPANTAISTIKPCSSSEASWMIPGITHKARCLHRHDEESIGHHGARSPCVEGKEQQLRRKVEKPSPDRPLRRRSRSSISFNSKPTKRTSEAELSNSDSCFSYFHQSTTSGDVSISSTSQNDDEFRRFLKDLHSAKQEADSARRDALKVVRRFRRDNTSKYYDVTRMQQQRKAVVKQLEIYGTTNNP